MKSDYANICIEMARSKNYKICIWGTGPKAQNLGIKLLDKLGISVNFFCDCDEHKWGMEIAEKIVCVSPKELQREPERYICFVMVNVENDKETMESVKRLGIKWSLSFYDLLCADLTLYTYFPFMQETEQQHLRANVENSSKENGEYISLENERVAIYTCIVGGYDEPIEPHIVEKQCDYYLISDVPPAKGSIYKWIDIKEYKILENLGAPMINRFCKMHPHLFFRDYKYSIYIDGNLELKKEISMKYLGYLREKKTRIACFERRGGITDIYEDGLYVGLAGREDEGTIFRQLQRYWNCGLPRHHGQIAGRTLIREHNHPTCIKIMQDWWEEFSTQAHRDQLSFMYAVWKNGFTYEDVGIMQNGGWNTEECLIRLHK